jgi:hypothetical protein
MFCLTSNNLTQPEGTTTTGKERTPHEIPSSFAVQWYINHGTCLIVPTAGRDFRQIPLYDVTAFGSCWKFIFSSLSILCFSQQYPNY